MHDRASCTVGKPLQINRTMIISWYTICCWFNLPWITGCAVFLASNEGVTDFAYGQNLSSTLCPLWGSPLDSSLEPFDHFCRDTPEASRNSKRCTNRPPSALLHSSGAVFIVLAKHTGSLKRSGLLPEMRIGAPFIYQFNAKKTTKIKWLFKSRLIAQVPAVVKVLLPSLQNNLGSPWAFSGFRLNRRMKQLMSDLADCR